MGVLVIGFGEELTVTVTTVPWWYGGPGETLESAGVPGARVLSSMVTTVCWSCRLTWLNSFASYSFFWPRVNQLEDTGTEMSPVEKSGSVLSDQPLGVAPLAWLRRL